MSFNKIGAKKIKLQMHTEQMHIKETILALLSAGLFAEVGRQLRFPSSRAFFLNFGFRAYRPGQHRRVL